MLSAANTSGGRVPRVPFLTCSPRDGGSCNSSLRTEQTTATLRCGEENSSARIFIRNSSPGFANDFNCCAPEQSAIRNPQSATRPPLHPFDHCHAVRLQVFFQTGADDLRG